MSIESHSHHQDGHPEGCPWSGLTRTWSWLDAVYDSKPRVHYEQSRDYLTHHSNAHTLDWRYLAMGEDYIPDLMAQSPALTQKRL